MSDTHGAAPAPDDALDHPFDSADQAAFDAMRAADGPSAELPGIPGPGGGDAGAGADAGSGGDGAGAGAAEPGAGGVEPAAEASGAEPAAGAAGEAPAAGAQPAAGSAEDDDADEADEGAAAPGADGQARKPRRVSARKLQVALERAEAAEREREAMTANLVRSREDFARLSERLAILNEALTAPADQAGGQDADPEPDPNEDIFAHNAWLKRQVTKANERVDALARRGEQSEGAHQLESAYTADATAFARTPEGKEFPNAYRFLINSRWVELGASRFFKDLTTPEGVRSLAPQERAWIARQVQAEERQIVANALQHQRSPSQTIMMLARSRGFAPPQAPAAGGAAPGAAGAAPAAGAAAGVRPGNGAAAPAAGGAQPSVTQEIERLRKGQESSLSLSGGAAAPNQLMTVDRLLAMSEADFDEYVDMLGAEGIRQLHGMPSQ